MDEKNKKGPHCLLTKGENCVLDNKRADDRWQNKVAALLLENFSPLMAFTNSHVTTLHQLEASIVL